MGGDRTDVVPPSTSSSPAAPPLSPVTRQFEPPAQAPSWVAIPDEVACGAPRCQAPVVAVSVPLGLVVQPVAVSKPSEKTVVPPPPPPKSEKRRRFGEPVPGLPTTPVVALPTIAAATVAALWLPNCERYRAATPATCGVAIDVPLIVLVAVSLVFHVEVMLEPGAKTSTQVPKFENDERASVVVVDPTVSAVATRAGEELQAFALLLPAAIAYVTPEAIELATAVSRAVETPPPRLMFATAGR